MKTKVNHHAYFLKHNETIHLRIGYGLSFVKQEGIKHGAMDVLMNTETKQCASIYYSMYEEGYTVFTRYKNPKGILTIGSSIEDDFYLQEPLLQQGQITLDFDQHEVVNHARNNILAVNHAICNQHRITNGDLIQVANLQLVVHEDFLMVNAVSNLYRNLEPYAIEINNPLPTFEVVKVVRRFKDAKLNTTFEEELMEPLQLHTYQQRPLLFTMGPAITMSFASLASGMVATYNGYLNGRSVYEMLPMLLLPSVMLISSLVWNPLQNHYEKKKYRQLKEERFKDYNDYLTLLKSDLETFQQTYINEVNTYIPCLNDLQNDDLQTTLYQTLPHQNDYLMIRLGSCKQAFDLKLNHRFYFKKTDELFSLVEDIKQTYKEKDNCPFVVSFKTYKHIVLSGDLDTLFKELVLQLTYHHAPDLLKFVFLMDQEDLEENEWIYFMDHAMDDSKTRRYIARSRNEAIALNRILQEDTTHTFFFVAKKPSLLQAFTVKDLHILEFETEYGIPASADVTIHLENDRGYVQTKTSMQTFYDFHPTKMDLKQYFHVLNFYQIETMELQTAKMHPTFFDLYNVEDVQSLNIEKRWMEHRVIDGIEAVIGLNQNYEQVKIDFHEKGNGPHGLLAGSTGSGKSELLITLLLSLAINYSYEELQFVMIDFKGGGASVVLSNESYQLPHMKGILSNLDVGFMERALVSFHNECIKRQKLFQQMSTILNRPIMNLSSYQENYRSDLNLPYLAALLIVVDEFAELKKEKPEFMKDLISLARIGRSLGIHLLLATQKPTGVVNDQIWSNSRFKIALKVQDAQDSKEMIHTSDASFIKEPGEFYFLCDGLLSKGKAGYANAMSGKPSSSVTLLAPSLKEMSTKAKETEENPTQVELIIQEILSISKQKKPCSQLWLDPLTVETIEQASSKKAYHKGVYLGIIDDFYHHKQVPLYFEPQDRSLFVVSIDRNAKLEFLKTLLYSLLVQTTNKDEIYVIDDLALPMHHLEDVSQMIAVFDSSDEERMRNLFTHLRKRSVDTSNTCYLIINDYASFQHANEVNQDRFLDLLEHIEQRNVKLIVFASLCNAISYRAFTLLPNRISLHNENMQELMTLFEQPVHKVVNKKFTGLCKRKNVLEFMYPSVSTNAFETLVAYLTKQAGTKKPYILQTMPKRIEECMNPTSKYLLGKNIETYDLCLIDPSISLLILSTYEEESYAFLQHAKDMHRNVKEYPDTNFENQAVWYFASIDQFKTSSYDLRMQFKNILYIGLGFKDQYMFVSSYKKPLKANQGIFFSKGRNQVIQLVE